jgi:hypothetical protein
MLQMWNKFTAVIEIWPGRSPSKADSNRNVPDPCSAVGNGNGAYVANTKAWKVYRQACEKWSHVVTDQFGSVSLFLVAGKDILETSVTLKRNNMRCPRSPLTIPFAAGNEDSFPVPQNQ